VRPVVTVAFAFAGDRLDDRYAARLVLANMLGSIMASGSGHYTQHDLAGGFEYVGNFEPAKAAAAVDAFRAGIDAIVYGWPRYLAAFESARSRIARSMWGSTQSATGWEAQLQYAVSLGRDLVWLRDLAPRITRVTYDDIVAIARAELQLDRANIVVSGPHDAVDATCKALGRTPTWLDGD
jgi:predicted Zn-dependent peptidase